MRVFVTGATGFIGSVLVPELIQAGHTVLGLTRSESGAKQLEAAGAEVHRGDIYNLDSLRSGAANADAVIHLAFNHDFSKFAENCATDRGVIEAIGEVLAGSDRPFVITSGTAIANTVPGEPATESSPIVSSSVVPRAATEEAANAVAARGVNVSIVRLPQVHDTVKQGLISYYIPLLKQKGFAAYIGDGSTRWPAAHVTDVADLYRLALERAEKGAIYNAVAEEGVTNKAIAEVLAKGFGIPVKSIAPEEAGEYYGFLAHFAGRDLAASSVETRKKLNWNPTGPDLLTDLANMDYSAG